MKGSTIVMTLFEGCWCKRLLLLISTLMLTLIYFHGTIFTRNSNITQFSNRPFTNIVTNEIINFDCFSRKTAKFKIGSSTEFQNDNHAVPQFFLHKAKLLSRRAGIKNISCNLTFGNNLPLLTVKKACSRRKRIEKFHRNYRFLNHFLVDEKRKVLFCAVPKVASSNWRRFFILLKGKVDPSFVMNNSVYKLPLQKYLRTLNTYSKQQIEHILKYYFKVMFVREPLSRIVSAYADKFERGDKRSYNRLGLKIVKKFRNFSDITTNGNIVTFAEFVKHLLRLKQKKLPFTNNHWQLYDELCKPCTVHYDFIGKYETMERDVNFLLRKLGVANMTFPSRDTRNHLYRKKFSTSQYLDSLTVHDLQSLRDIYSVDYDMFGY